MRWFAAGLLFVVVALLNAHGAQAAQRSSDSYGLFDPVTGIWHLYLDDVQISEFYFGDPGDYPMMGDWDCDGVDTPGLYRQSDGYVYLRNSNTAGVADLSFYFGDPGDVPLAGDFNADGCDSVSVYRPDEARFYIINELGVDDGGLGAADYSFIFGDPGDKPFTGSFLGGGWRDTVGLHRESTGFVYLSYWNLPREADVEFYFGNPDDRIFTGDWTGSTYDTPGIFRPSDTTVYLRYDNLEGSGDESWTVGESDWLPVAGRFAFFTTCSDQISIPESECEALIGFYHSTNEPSGLYNWLYDPNPCKWTGVTCRGGSVVALVFIEVWMSGTLPAELANLVNLETLVIDFTRLIYGNTVSGTIPAELGQLANLDTLILAHSDLSGTIPAELSNLAKLRVLDLDRNELTGTIPPELGKLANLLEMDLSANQLSGTIPAELSNLGKLRVLDLDWNELTGTIPPELGSLANLLEMSLYDNQLSGTIPAELGQLSTLVLLTLASNSLSGTVPSELQNLKNLQTLSLNSQTGCLAAATPEFATWLAGYDPRWNDGC